MTDKDWVVAFAGPGETTEENVKVLLDRWLPQGVAEVIVPERVPRACKGLKTTVSWLTEEFGEDALTRTKDIVAELKTAVADDEVETYLVLLWGDEGDPDSEALLSAATDLGIPVKDLTAGLDDVQFEEDSPADPDPDPPKRERKTRGKSREKDLHERRRADRMQDPEYRAAYERAGRELAQTDAVTPSAEAASGTHARHPATKAQEEANGDAPRTRGKPRAVAADIDKGAAGQVEHEPDGTRSPVSLPDAKAPAAIVADTAPITFADLAKALHDFADTLVPKTPGRPHKDGTPAQPRGPKTTAYLLKDGEYTKRGRGRPSPDEGETVWLTDEEISDLGL